MQKITIIKQKEVKTEKTSFTPFKVVDANGKLIDCRFKKDVNLSVFDNGTKFTCDAEVSDASAKYEFPRWYVSNIANVEKIY